jgi:G3E family GTPase
MKRKEKFDAILVETTGLADPAPVAQTFFVDEDIAERTCLDAIVIVADTKFLNDQLVRNHEAQEQVAFADIVLLNKIDLVTLEELERLEKRIRAMNPYARILRTERCRISLDEVMGKKAFDLKRVLETEPSFLEEEEHQHDDEIKSISLVADRPLNSEAFQRWFQTL